MQSCLSTLTLSTFICQRVGPGERVSRFQHGHCSLGQQRSKKSQLLLLLLFMICLFCQVHFTHFSILIPLGCLSAVTSHLHCILSISLPFPDCPSWETNSFLSVSQLPLPLPFLSHPFSPILNLSAMDLPSLPPCLQLLNFFLLFVLFALSFLLSFQLLLFIFSHFFPRQSGLDFDFLFLLGCKSIFGFQIYLYLSGSDLFQSQSVNPLKTRTTGSSSLNAPQDPVECLVQAECITEGFQCVLIRVVQYVSCSPLLLKVVIFKTRVAECSLHLCDALCQKAFCIA